MKVDGKKKTSKDSSFGHFALFTLKRFIAQIQM